MAKRVVIRLKEERGEKKKRRQGKGDGIVREVKRESRGRRGGEKRKETR